MSTKKALTAFPIPGLEQDADFNGMSLKAYYAAKIMQGFCANPAVFAPNSQCGWDLVNMDPHQLASYVDVVASALLEQVPA